MGNVINALVDNSKGISRFIHYRDSKLTFLLKDSLGGNSKTTIIANISPIQRAYGETLSTLQFARRAKMIKNKAIINEETSGSVAHLQREIKDLRSQIMNYQNRFGMWEELDMLDNNGQILMDQGEKVSTLGDLESTHGYTLNALNISHDYAIDQPRRLKIKIRDLELLMQNNNTIMLNTKARHHNELERKSILMHE